MDTITSMVTGKSVVIFSRSTSDMSHSIVSLITGYGANPTVYELDQIPNGQAIERALVEQLKCEPSVPAVFIGQQFVGGTNQVMTLQLRNQLAPKLLAANAIWLWNQQ
ncbi:hypothetical protein ACLB2K_014255 [Fragaria x ananassa]